MNKTSFLLSALAILLVTNLSHSCCNGAAISEFVAGDPSIELKRSLCNTFGGCGSKRSVGLNRQMQQAINYNGNANNENNNLDNSIPTTSIHLRAGVGANSPRFDQNQKNELIAEALNSLFEYLENDERFKQGKYTISVPRGYPDAPLANSRRAFETLDSAYIQDQVNRMHHQTNTINQE